MLAVASLYFYAAWKRTYLFLLLGSILLNFFLGLLARQQDRRRTAVIIGVVINLLLLCYFKYATFLVDNFNLLAGTNLKFEKIILPIGISFFTFQQIAYLVDLKRNAPVERNPINFTLFVTFFPHLIAGPLVHHAEMIPQFKSTVIKRFAVLAARGIAIAIAGLFKKVVLADNFAPMVSHAYDMAAAGQTLDFFTAWQGAIAFKFQLYFDFSGYSEMALGAARLFGVQLPLNFNSPLRALNVVDYWRRWHMTLSRWLRDYIYIPLGGSRCSTGRLYFNLMVTMALSGLWHGAAWHFALWGSLQGGAMVMNHAWRSVWRPINAWWSNTVARFVTFFGLTMLLVTHRAPSMDVAMRVFHGMFNLPHSWQSGLGPLAAGLGWLGVHFDGPPVSADQQWLVLWLIFWLAVVWFLPNTQQMLARWHPAFNYGVAERQRDPPLLERAPSVARLLPWRLEWRPNAAAAVVVGLLAALAFLNLHHVSEFLYFKY